MLKKINKIKTSFWERNFSLAKISYQVGIAKILELISKKPQNLERIEVILNEFSELKGSLMKAGQLLTVYGQSYIPPEGLKILERLQESTSYVGVEEIEKIINESGSKILKDHKLDEIPFASASIGQVHLAKKGDDIKVVKVQYPGIEKSIAIDLLVLKSFLKLFKILPKKLELQGVFNVIEEMLHQELDYTLEQKSQQFFYESFKDRYHVPRVLESFSNSKVLVSEYTPGIRIQDTMQFSQEERNQLGEDFIDLALTEIFHLQKIQSDPNPANFKIDPKTKKWILYDFGACQNIPKPKVADYKVMLQGLLENNGIKILDAFCRLDAMEPNDPPEYKEAVLEYTEVLSQVFEGDSFDWAKNNLEAELLEKGKKLLFLYPHKTPPYQTVFIDRKLSGVFFILRMLKSKTLTRKIVEKYVY